MRDSWHADGLFVELSIIGEAAQQHYRQSLTWLRPSLAPVIALRRFGPPEIFAVLNGKQLFRGSENRPIPLMAITYGQAKCIDCFGGAAIFSALTFSMDIRISANVPISRRHYDRKPHRQK